MGRSLEKIVNSFEPVRNVVNHPVVSSLLLYSVLQYARHRFPELDTPSSGHEHPFDRFISASTYVFYSLAGLIKAYGIEKTKLGLKGKSIYKWLLDNPKIAAIASTALVDCTIDKRNVLDILSIGAGIFTEAFLRGIKNLRRIKNSIRKVKTTLVERIYNIPFEHPIVLAGAYTVHEAIATRKELYGRDIGDIVFDIENLPRQTIANFLIYGFRGAIFIGGSLLASSVLHSYSLREYYLSARKGYYNLRKNKDKVMETQQRIVDMPNSLERRIEALVELGNIYYKSYNSDNDQESYRKAFESYRKALRLFSKKQDEFSYSDFFRKTFGINRLLRLLRKRKQRDDEQGSINRMFIDLLNKNHRAIDEIEAIVNNDSNNPELVYMYGKALEILGYTDQAEAQKVRAIKMIRSSSTELFSRSKNTVILLNGSELHGEIVGKSAPEEELYWEFEATKRIRKELMDFGSYDTPIPIGIIDIDRTKYYVMERINCPTLEEVIKAASTEDVKKEGLIKNVLSAADFMALIHARLKPREDRKTRETSIENITDRLIIVGMPQDIISSIGNNLYPVFDSLESILAVVDKDSHPGNWMIDNDGSVIAIDMELRRGIPMTHDYAKLIGLGSALDAEEKDTILEKYLSSFERYTKVKKLDRRAYHLAYLNSVVIRSLEVYSLCLKHEKMIRNDLLEGSQIAIRRIEQEHPDYYVMYGGAYEKLNAAIEQLKASSLVIFT